MLNCIQHIFGYLYCSPNTFPKIKQILGGQLEIRLSVYSMCRIETRLDPNKWGRNLF